MNCKSSVSWISSRTVFLECCIVTFFPSQPHKKPKNHHNAPIMTKTNTASSATPSHATPVKANTGKLVVKDKFLRVGEEPVTPPKQPSPASISTATTASLILLNQESSLESVSTASTATTALSISSSQSTTTTTAKQSNLSNCVRTLNFGNLPIAAKKAPYLINFCDPFDVKS
jgi:hypothetical protein